MSEEKSEKSALLLDDNLMSTGKVQAQLARAGWQVQTARKLSDSSTSTLNAPPELIVINLGSRGIPGVELIGSCRQRFPNARIVGFCGHLETEIRRAAKAAGIDKILTNDAAFSQLVDSL